MFLATCVKGGGGWREGSGRGVVNWLMDSCWVFFFVAAGGGSGVCEELGSGLCSFVCDLLMGVLTIYCYVVCAAGFLAGVIYR